MQVFQKRENYRRTPSTQFGSDPQIRRGAIDSFLTIYSLKSGKEQDIWNELLKISGDTDTGVRKGAASMLSRVFPVVEEKSTVFSDLVKLAESPDSLLRKKAAELFTVAFAYSDDKQKHGTIL